MPTKPTAPLLWFSIVVRGRRWAVYLSAADISKELGAGMPTEDRSSGAADPYTHSVYVDAGQTTAEIDSTTLHELMHVCLASSYVWPSERVVTALEPTLWRLLSDLGFKWPDKPRGWRAMQRHARSIDPSDLE